MDQGVVSILKLLLFVIMATTIALDIVTAATVSSSMKKPYNHLVFNRVFDESVSLQLDDDNDFVLSQIERKLEESEFTASMDALPDRKDVEALVSFRNGVKFDPYGSLLNWTAQNSERVCSWNGIRCRKGTNRVVAITLSGLGLEGSLPPSLGSLSFLRSLNLSNNNFTGRIPHLSLDILKRWDYSTSALICYGVLFQKNCVIVRAFNGSDFQ